MDLKRKEQKREEDRLREEHAKEADEEADARHELWREDDQKRFEKEQGWIHKNVVDRDLGKPPERSVQQKRNPES